jgi:hypothetical protein
VQRMVADAAERNPELGEPIRSQLRQLLAAPVLDGFSAVLARARDELDVTWRETIAQPYRGALASERLAELYDPGAGALSQFLEKHAAGFFRGGRARALLGDRALAVDAKVLQWIAWAQENGLRLARGGASPARALRLRGVPSSIDFSSGASRDVNVRSRTLRFSCPDGQEEFVYREGSGEQQLRWGAGCEEISLRIALASSAGEDRGTLERVWSGPGAYQEFMEAARRAGRRRIWEVQGEEGSTEGIRVEAPYDAEEIGGSRAPEPGHRPPPASLAG